MVDVLCEVTSCKKNNKGLCSAISIKLSSFGKWWDEAGNEEEYDAAVVCEQYEE